MNRDILLIIATAILATAFAIGMYYTGVTKWLMGKL